jgi:hypothetical protein
MLTKLEKRLRSKRLHKKRRPRDVRSAIMEPENEVEETPHSALCRLCSKKCRAQNSRTRDRTCSFRGESQLFCAACSSNYMSDWLDDRDDMEDDLWLERFLARTRKGPVVPRGPPREKATGSVGAGENKNF